MQKQASVRRIELSEFVTFSCPVKIRVLPQLARPGKSLFFLGRNSRRTGNAARVTFLSAAQPGFAQTAADGRPQRLTNEHARKVTRVQNEKCYFAPNLGFRTEGEFILRSLEMPAPKRCGPARTDLQWFPESRSTSAARPG
jgi:hypothetical protein